MIKVGQIVSDITANMNPFRKSMTRVEKEGEKAARSVGKKFQQMGQSMRSVGGTMTRNITLPIAAASAAIFKFGSDFEAEMSKITGLVGVASDQTEQWSTQIRDMAGEVGRGPKELAQAMFFVTSAGFRGAQAMEVLEMSAKASAAGLGETKAVADLVTSAINAYGKENISAARATDVLTAAVREGKLEAETLAPVMGRLLPMANDLGIQFDELAGFMAAMSRTGLEATEASTALRGIMKVLVKPTQEAREQLEAVGLSFQDLRTQVKDEGLLSVLKDLQTAFAGNEEAMANVFPDVRGLIGVLNVLGQDSKVVGDIMEGVSDSSGDMQTAFDEAAKTGRHAFNQMMAEAHSLTIDFFDGLKGSLVPVIKQVTGLISNMRSVWRGMSDGAKQATGVIAGLAAAIGPAALGLGWAIRLAIPAGRTLIKVVKGLTAAMVKNPYLAVGAALAYIGGQAIFAHMELKKLHSEVQVLLQSQDATLDQVNKKIAELGEEYSKAAKTAKTIPGMEAEDLVDPKTAEQLQKLIELRDKLAAQSPVNPGAISEMERLQIMFSLMGDSMEDIVMESNAMNISRPFVEAKKPVDDIIQGLGMAEQKMKTFTDQDLMNMWEEGVDVGEKIAPPGSIAAAQERIKQLRQEMLYATNPETVEQLRAKINELSQTTKDSRNVWQGFANTIGSALQQAVIHGKELGSILASLAKQLASKAIMTGLSFLLPGGAIMGKTGFFDAMFGGMFHEGGIVGGNGDVPIVAQAGEGVFTKGQMEAMGGLIRNGGNKQEMSMAKMQRAFENALRRTVDEVSPSRVFELSQQGKRSF